MIQICRLFNYGEAVVSRPSVVTVSSFGRQKLIESMILSSGLTLQRSRYCQWHRPHVNNVNGMRIKPVSNCIYVNG